MNEVVMNFENNTTVLGLAFNKEMQRMEMMLKAKDSELTAEALNVVSDIVGANVDDLTEEGIVNNILSTINKYYTKVKLFITRMVDNAVMFFRKKQYALDKNKISKVIKELKSIKYIKIDKIEKYKKPLLAISRTPLQTAMKSPGEPRVSLLFASYSSLLETTSKSIREILKISPNATVCTYEELNIDDTVFESILEISSDLKSHINKRRKEEEEKIDDLYEKLKKADMDSGEHKSIKREITITIKEYGKLSSNILNMVKDAVELLEFIITSKADSLDENIEEFRNITLGNKLQALAKAVNGDSFIDTLDELIGNKVEVDIKDTQDKAKALNREIQGVNAKNALTSYERKVIKDTIESLKEAKHIKGNKEVKDLLDTITVS